MSKGYHHFIMRGCICGTLALGFTSADAFAQDKGGHDLSDTGLEAIVVTAQRRDERLIDVPVSVTLISSELLKNAEVTNSTDLELITPGLRMDQTSSYVQPAIRGVTTTLSGTTDGNVATYVDGVYQSSLQMAMFDLRDVSSIEVLKGPQGTLFGRNATGGAILIRTLAPDLQELKGSLALGYSSFETKTGSGFVSIPIIPGKAALSLSGTYDNMSKGFLKDLVNGGKTGAVKNTLVRGKLRFVPFDGADFTLIGLYAKIKDGAVYNRTNLNGVNRFRDQILAAGLPFADKPYETSGDYPSISINKIRSVSLSGDIKVGPGTLTTRTAYLDNDNHLISDLDGTPLPLILGDATQSISTFSQELIYATDQLGRFRAIGGVFYYNKDVALLPYQANNYAFAVWAKEDIEAYAFFGEMTYDLTDRLSITGGVRYSNEKYAGSVTNTGGGDPTPPAVIPKFASKTWDSLDPRVSIVYKFDNNINVYATFSQGFKSGYFNTASRQATPIDPEKIDAYEIGIKGALGGTFLFNAAAFYYDYTDLQQLRRYEENGITLVQVQNAASVEVKGFEIGGTWRVSDGFNLNFGAQYLDAVFDKFPDASVTTPITQSMIIAESLDVSGNRMVRSPKWSGTVTAEYTQETSIGNFYVAGTFFATSKIYHDVANRVVEPAYVKLNASLGWEPRGIEGMKLKLWGRNLTDSTTIQATTFSGTYDAVTYEPPRSYGVELSYKF